MHRQTQSTLLIALALALGGGLSWWMLEQERRVLGPSHARALSDAGPGSPPASIAIEAAAELLSRTQLICVEVRTSVEARSDHPSWRGDVLAGVRVPVRLLYGTDLSRFLETDVLPAISSSPMGQGVVVRVPAPTRLAAEVLSDAELVDVRVSGLRFRDIAGEYHLGVARSRTSEAARALVLTDDQRLHIERETRERVEAIVHAVLGADVPVEVVLVPKGAQEASGP
jgi:hypothetical protein